MEKVKILQPVLKEKETLPFSSATVVPAGQAEVHHQLMQTVEPSSAGAIQELIVAMESPSAQIQEWIAQDPSLAKVFDILEENVAPEKALKQILAQQEINTLIANNPDLKEAFKKLEFFPDRIPTETLAHLKKLQIQ